MKLTLLEIVQSILSSADGDEINSITDSTESLKAAYAVKDSYMEMMARANLPEHYTLFELTASGDNTKPTLMTKPSDIDTILWIKYDNRESGDTYPTFKEVYPMELKEFLEYVHSFDTSASYFGNMQLTLNGDAIDFFYYKDTHPKYYSVVEDNQIIFDSYLATLDDTLQKSKTMAYGMKVPTFTMNDSYYPDMDSNMFPLLLAEAKRQFFVEDKQVANPIAEQRSRRGWTRSQKVKQNIDTRSYYSKYPDYGRK